MEDIEENFKTVYLRVSEIILMKLEQDAIKEINSEIKNEFLQIKNKRNRLPRWLSGKESACNAGDADSVPGSRRSPGEGNGNPLQYFCLENLMDSEAWQATVHGVAKSLT